MTTADLITNVLEEISKRFYGQSRVREFQRDLTALSRAIARYGYECHSRGWELEAVAIQEDLLALLRSMVPNQAKIEYLPIYLEGAVDRHIRLRAEELQAAAVAAESVVKRTMAGVRVGEAPAALSTTAALAALYRDLRFGRKRHAAAPVARQLGLI